VACWAGQVHVAERPRHGGHDLGSGSSNPQDSRARQGWKEGKRPLNSTCTYMHCMLHCYRLCWRAQRRSLVSRRQGRLAGRGRCVLVTPCKPTTPCPQQRRHRPDSPECMLHALPPQADVVLGYRTVEEYEVRACELRQRLVRSHSILLAHAAPIHRIRRPSL
jgi:hypothetical protein